MGKVGRGVREVELTVLDSNREREREGNSELSQSGLVAQTVAAEPAASTAATAT